ncbi:MAG TPA: ABC transporter permease [Candidatus Limnocylindrales bacterium]|nr:ABC transporter permease [Candidatus Limnocylindrales bacterium]
MTASAAARPRHGRVGIIDLARVGAGGLSARRLRTGLTALGIAIGIAAMMAVLGISESSRADLLATLDRLGTNLLTVSAGRTIFGEDSALPEEAPGMIGRIAPVEAVSGVENLGVAIHRSDYIPDLETGGLSVLAADASLLDTLGGELADGRNLDAAMENYPTAVLGSVAAARLGIHDVGDGVLVDIGGQWFAVVGILEELPLAPEIDRAALIGLPIAKDRFGATGSPTTIYVRAAEAAIDDVRSVLPATTNPANPEEVDVSRPSEVIAAKAAAATTFTALFLGLGAVALLVGGLGIANVMLMAVLERRSEIGLRRALGATRGHIVGQFLAEALLLAGVGGVLGVLLGSAVSAAYATSQGWLVALPWVGIVGGIGLAVVMGAAAGLYPAFRAARVAPTDALRTA